MGVLAVGTLDGRVVLHDAETFAELWGKETPPINSNGTMGVVVSPGGSTLASVSADLTCKLLDSSSGDLRRTLAGHDSHGYCSCKLVRPPRGGGVECDEISADCSVSGHADALWAAAFSPAGRRLATCSRDGTSRIWATNKQNPPSGMGSAVRSRRRESGFGQECLRVGEVTPAAERFEGWVRAVAFSPDGTCCATGHNDFSVRIWDSHTGEELQRCKNHTGAVWSVAFSPCGEKLASASQDRTVKIWDVVSGFLLRTLGIRMHLPFDICGYVRSVAFSPTGNLLASGGEDKVLRVWCSKTGLLQRSLTGHRNVIRAVAFSLDGKLLASGSLDKTVRLYSAPDFEHVTTLDFVACVLSLAFGCRRGAAPAPHANSQASARPTPQKLSFASRALPMESDTEENPGTEPGARKPQPPQPGPASEKAAAVTEEDLNRSLRGCSLS